MTILGALLFAGASLIGPAHAEVAEADAGAGIEDFHGALIAAMQMPGHAEREAALLPVAAELFDLPRIAGISLGRTWRDLDESQRQAFQDNLLALIVATYADRFDSYGDQQFVTDDVQAVRTGHVVRTRLLRPGEDDVTLDYFVRDGRVFNVVADGVSDLSLRRADYTSHHQE